MINDVLPLLCLVLVPTLLALVGLYLYKKANAQKPGKKKAKDKKSKKKWGEKKNYLNKFLKNYVLPYLSLLILHSHILNKILH